MDRSSAFGIATDAIITDAIAGGAFVAFSVSGGKDSAAATLATNHYLDAIGHDRARRIVIHADLGRIEWMTTPRHVEALAARAGLELVVVRRQAGDLITRWQQRFANGEARYEALTTYGLAGRGAAARSGSAPANSKRTSSPPSCGGAFPARPSCRSLASGATKAAAAP